MARALARANEVGIPVITWDSDLLAEDAGLRTTYIGTENRAMGVEQAKLLQKLKPDGGTICIQSGGAAAMNHNERMQGFRDTLAGADSGEPPGKRLEGANKWTEVAACPLYTNDDFPLAVQQMADILASAPDLDVFSITGGFPQFVDQAYRQAVEPYRERIESKDLVIIGADVLPMQLDPPRRGPEPRPGRAAAVRDGLPVDGGAAPAGRRPERRDPIYTGLDVLTGAEDVEAFRSSSTRRTTPVTAIRR